jgi:hypothetical protein
MTPIERHARTLLLFSLASLPLVIAFGTLRGIPAMRALLETPEAARSVASFHSHFDQLCWLGAAALGAALFLLREGYRGPAWAVRWLARAYIAGSLLFSVAHAVRAAGVAAGSERLARGGFGLLVSVGGTLLLVAMATGAIVAWSFGFGAPASEPAARRE